MSVFSIETTEKLLNFVVPFKRINYNHIFKLTVVAEDKINKSHKYLYIPFKN